MGCRCSDVCYNSIFHRDLVLLRWLIAEDQPEVCHLSVWGKVGTPIPGITLGIRFLQFPLPAGLFRRSCD